MKNKVDIIILAYTMDLKAHQMTQACIDSAVQLDPQIDFNILLIESNAISYFTYKLATRIIPKIPFNYNLYLNIGLNYCRKDTDLIVFANNDLLFTNQWASNLLKAFETHKLDSACPLEPRHHLFIPNDSVKIGTAFRQEVIGWCIAVKPKTIEIIGKFDDQFNFYFQDNDYIMNLKKHKLKHGLVCNSVVYHLLSQSHRFLTKEEREYLAKDGKEKFQKKWNVKI